MSTEMSDLAAVRIHSNTISIFSSRPIISRNRCTDGDWSSVLIWARRSRKASSSSATLARSGRLALMRWGESPVRRATPKSTSSLTQFSTSRRMRPKVAMSDSRSKDSPGGRSGSGRARLAAATAQGCENALPSDPTDGSVRVALAARWAAKARSFT